MALEDQSSLRDNGAGDADHLLPLGKVLDHPLGEALRLDGL